jgi:hypothetical protein
MSREIGPEGKGLSTKVTAVSLSSRCRCGLESGLAELLLTLEMEGEAGLDLGIPLLLVEGTGCGSSVGWEAGSWGDSWETAEGRGCGGEAAVDCGEEWRRRAGALWEECG